MTKICAVAVRPGEGTSAVAAGAECIEYRLDLFPAVPQDFSFFSQPVPTIATFRGCEEFELFQAALDAGASYVDVEGYSPLRDEYPGHTICSLHDFDRTPPADTILEDMADLAESGLPKCAYSVSSVSDLVSIAEAAAVLRQQGNPFILIGMGSAGRLTRARAEHLGSYLTYVSLGTSAAPGEFTLPQTMAMTLHPRVTGILGSSDAVRKSRSPQIHGAAFQAAQMPGIYLPFALRDDEVSLVPRLMQGYALDGLNVTMPYKQAVIPYLSTLSASASRAGSVNTITADLAGDTTDTVGVAALVQDIDIAGKSVLVLGAGGAARAACTELSSRGAVLTIANRTEEKARDLAARFGCSSMPLSRLSPDYDVVLVASPVLPVEASSVLTAKTVAIDMAYPDSPFLQAAREMGCKTVSGMPMLIAQAAASFAAWFGIEPDTEAMTRAGTDAS